MDLEWSLQTGLAAVCRQVLISISIKTFGEEGHSNLKLFQNKKNVHITKTGVLSVDSDIILQEA